MSGVVLVEDGVTARRPCPGAKKTVSTMIVPAEQLTELHADDGDDRDERLPEGVFQDDGPLRQPLGARGPMYAFPRLRGSSNVPGGPRRPRSSARSSLPENQAAASRPGRWPAASRARAREGEDEEQAEPEARHGDAASATSIDSRSSQELGEARPGSQDEATATAMAMAAAAPAPACSGAGRRFLDDGRLLRWQHPEVAQRGRGAGSARTARRIGSRSGGGREAPPPAPAWRGPAQHDQHGVAGSRCTIANTTTDTPKTTGSARRAAGCR